MSDLSQISGPLKITRIPSGAYLDMPFEVEGVQGQVTLKEILEYLSESGGDPGGGAGGSLTRYTQQIEAQSTAVITVTANGGELPPQDDQITLYGPTGVLLQGPGAGKYAINRSGSPHELILHTVPQGPINLYLEFFINNP